MSSLALSAAVCAAAAPAFAALGAPKVERLAGTSALPGGSREVRATLIVRPHDARTADFAMFETRAGRTLRAYDVEMTQREHLIVVADDFRTFRHLHPALGRDGRFRIRVRVPRPGRYYVYADTRPHEFGRQVFRFDVDFGIAPPPAPAGLRPSSRTVRAGPYAVSLDTLRSPAGRASMLGATILRGGRPARDLKPYLGAAAHAVFINVRTLAYLHVHPETLGADMPAMHDGENEPATGNKLPAATKPNMPGMPDMPGMAGTPNVTSTPSVAGTHPRASTPSPQAESNGFPRPPANASHEATTRSSLRLHVPPTARGTYRLWLQFLGADGLHVAPFVLVAR